VRVALKCRSCLHQHDADLDALIEAGRGAAAAGFAFGCATMPASVMMSPTSLPWIRARKHATGRSPDTPPRPASPVFLVRICYNTAMASISIRNSGAASAVTATSVCAGIFFPKNSSRIGP
jgi:hypothetical protein